MNLWTYYYLFLWITVLEMQLYELIVYSALWTGRKDLKQLYFISVFQNKYSTKFASFDFNCSSHPRYIWMFLFLYTFLYYWRNSCKYRCILPQNIPFLSRCPAWCLEAGWKKTVGCEPSVWRPRAVITIGWSQSFPYLVWIKHK